MSTRTKRLPITLSPHPTSLARTQAKARQSKRPGKPTKLPYLAAHIFACALVANSSNPHLHPPNLHLRRPIPKLLLQPYNSGKAKSTAPSHGCCTSITFLPSDLHLHVQPSKQSSTRRRPHRRGPAAAWERGSGGYSALHVHVHVLWRGCVGRHVVSLFFLCLVRYAASRDLFLLVLAGYWLYLDFLDSTTCFVEVRRAGTCRRLSFELGRLETSSDLYLNVLLC
jgi:hypothetical protein